MVCSRGNFAIGVSNVIQIVISDVFSPPSMSNVGTGIAIPTAQAARLFTDAVVSSPTAVETLEDIIASSSQSKNVFGAVLEAGEDLESIITNVLMSMFINIGTDN